MDASVKGDPTHNGDCLALYYFRYPRKSPKLQAYRRRESDEEDHAAVTILTAIRRLAREQVCSNALSGYGLICHEADLPAKPVRRRDQDPSA